MSYQVSRKPKTGPQQSTRPRNYFDESLQTLSPNTREALRLMEQDPDGKQLISNLRKHQVTIQEGGSTLGGGGAEFRWDPEIPRILVDQSYSPREQLMFLGHEATHAFLAYNDPEELNLSVEDRNAATGNTQHEEETAQRVALGILQRANIQPSREIFPGWNAFLSNYQDLPACDNSETVLRQNGFLLDNTQPSRTCPTRSPRPTGSNDKK